MADTFDSNDVLSALGGTSKTTIYKIELDKLSEAFIAPLKQGTVTLSTDLIASNVVAITVNGSVMAPVTFGTDHATTMAAVVTALKLLPTVATASYALDVITITPVDQRSGAILTNCKVTAGSSQPTVTTATVANRIFQGMPVKFDTAGNLVPAAAGDSPTVIFGNAYQTQNPEHGQIEITVIMKAHLTVIGQASGAVVAGPVKYDGWDTTTNRAKYSQSSVTYANIAGWALGTAADTVEVKVALVN